MILTRTRFVEAGIFGELSQDDGSFVAYSLEHSYDCKPKLPAGAYACVRGEHQLHSGPIETFEITGVPGHSGILLHPGNSEGDSEGCVLLGTSVSGDSLLASKAAFEAFLALVSGIDTFELTVVDSQQS